jgi:hypothetical protein
VFSRREEMAEFDSFISETELVDLPLIGRKFTWSKLDGSSMSRIDRFLLTENWCNQWPICSQWCLDKGLSDHCPILLCEKITNWGPKPFRTLNCWSEMEGYHKFVEEKWRSMEVNGWGAYVLKEKLNSIKSHLKDWHKSHLDNLVGRIDEA